MPSDALPEHYSFPYKVRTVAVIGAGATGAPAARQLRDHGLDVKVFERQAVSGGVWNWSPEIAPPLSVPTPPPSRGAFTPVLPDDVGPQKTSRPHGGDQRARWEFSPPNPVYWSLSNNVPTSTMAFKDFPYPPGTPENIQHYEIAQYIHDYVAHFHLEKNISFNTRVEKVVKVQGESHPQWRLTLRRLQQEEDGTATETYWTEDFDAVVAATGHYNAPYIPNLEGSSAWADAWPLKVLHSNGYREPSRYAGKTVLVVGIGTSGVEIARDLNPHAKKIYMVGRAALRGPDGYKTMRERQRLMLPSNGEAVAEIRRFIPPSPGSAIEDGVVELVDGRRLTGISGVIFSTGYQYGYPFLPHLHRDPTPTPPENTSQLVVTDGGGVLNLYRDVFWIPDPTLCFLGLSINTSAFSLFEYQSISAARVLSGQAVLPPVSSMREAYNAQVAEKGDGKFIHFLGQPGERKYVRETVAWLNGDAEWSGAKPVEGHSAEWLAASDKIHELIAKKYGLDTSKLERVEKKSAVPLPTGVAVAVS